MTDACSTLAQFYLVRNISYCNAWRLWINQNIIETKLLVIMASVLLLNSIIIIIFCSWRYIPSTSKNIFNTSQSSKGLIDPNSPRDQHFASDFNSGNPLNFSPDDMVRHILNSSFTR